MLDSRHLRQSLLSVYVVQHVRPASYMANADEADDAEQLQANSGGVEEDICPLGCDMAVYEALLEFR